MSRHLLTIYSKEDRERVMKYARVCPVGTRCEFKAIKRSLPQNDRLWACLTDIAAQKEHFGRKFPPEIWKILFMRAWQKEINLIPSLDGKEVVPITRSSDLSRQELSELLEFIVAWCAQEGVTLHDQQEKAA